jgi:hypothetical protein
MTVIKRFCILHRPMLRDCLGNVTMPNLLVCPKSAHHMHIGARKRPDLLLDVEGGYEVSREVLPVDPLKFKGSRTYPDRLGKAMEDTGETDALVVMGGAVHSVPVVVACFDFAFIAGPMGSAVGERFVRGVRNSLEQRTPFICIADRHDLGSPQDARGSRATARSPDTATSRFSRFRCKVPEARKLAVAVLSWALWNVRYQGNWPSPVARSRKSDTGPSWP